MDEEIPVYPHHSADTVLVNVHYVQNLSEVDVYIGPVNPAITEDLPDSVIYRFQNPFKISKFGREGAVENFKAKLYFQFLDSKKFRRQIRNLEGKTIADASYPDLSHGEAIINLLDELSRKDSMDVLNRIESELLNMPVEELGVEGMRYRNKALGLLDIDEDSLPEGQKVMTSYTEQ